MAARGCTLLAVGLVAALLGTLSLIIAVGDATTRLSPAPTRSPLPDLVIYGSPAVLLAMVVYLSVRAAVAFHRRPMGWLGQAASAALLVLAVGLMAPPGAQLLVLGQTHVQKRTADRALAHRAAERLRWQSTSIVVAGPAPGATNQPVDPSIVVLVDAAAPREHPPRLNLSRWTRRDRSQRVAGRTAISLDGRLISFVPEHRLLPGETYSLRLDNAPGNPNGSEPRIIAQGWSFTTDPNLPTHVPVRPKRIRVHRPMQGEATVVAAPGSLPISAPGRAPWGVRFDVDRCGRKAASTLLQANARGGFRGTIGQEGCSVSLEDSLWCHVLTPSGEEVGSFPVTAFADEDGVSYWVSPGVDASFTTAHDIVVEVPARAFKRSARVSLLPLPRNELRPRPPPGLEVAAFFSFSVEEEALYYNDMGASRCLSVSVPAPDGVTEDAQVFLVQPFHVSFEPHRMLCLRTVGGVRTLRGRRYLSFHPSVQPEPDGGTCADRMAATQGRSSCFTREGGFAPFAHRAARRLAVLYETDPVGWTVLLAGHTAYDKVASPAFYDSRRPLFLCTLGFVLPVPTGSEPVITARDIPTGWRLFDDRLVGRVPVTDAPYVRARDLDP